MTKIFKNRVVIMLLCSTLALGCILLYTSSIRSEAQKITVVRMKSHIAKGEVISDSVLETVTVGGYRLDKTVMTNKEDVVGKYAATDLVRGALVMQANLSDNILSSTDRLDQLDGHRVAYSITIKDFSNGLSDKLISGDIVSLYVSNDKTTKLPAELTYVEVLATTTSKGTDRENREDQTDNLATVTLLVTPKQALALTDYEDRAEIHLALVYRGDRETALAFLDKQDEVLKKT